MIYLFYGDNTKAARRQIDKLVERYKASTGSDLGLHRFDENSEPAQVVEAVTTVSMFSPTALVVVEHPSRSKSLIEALLEHIASVPAETVLVLFDPEIDKRTTWYKTLHKHATTKEFTPKSAAQLRRQAQQRLDAAGVHADGEVLDYLVEAVHDEWQLQQELDKLSHLTTHIDLDTVRQLLPPPPQHTIFTMLDALSSGDSVSALQRYDDLRWQRVHELEVLAMISWQLRTLVIINAVVDQPDEFITRQHHINPYVLRKAKPVARRIQSEALQQAYAETIATDYRIKSGRIDAEAGIEQLIMRIGDTIAGEG